MDYISPHRIQSYLPQPTPGLPEMSNMTSESQRAILAIALLAAFADGQKHDREREEIRRIADSLANAAGIPDLARLYQDVLLKRVMLRQTAAALSDANERQLAYEMAVCVCNADGRESPAEQTFLADLKLRFGLDTVRADLIESEADIILESSELPVPEAKLNESILNYALLNGALELLPQSWASMAIIPLQIKMVYGIGKAYGIMLDQGHIKEFIAAAGVGMTSQYLEQIGRKLLSGVLGKATGKTFGKIGGAATGMALSFATTYALGQLAKRYYAGGRKMSTALLKETFQSLLDPAKQTQAQYLQQIQQKAATLDAGQIMSLIRGS